MNMRSRERLSLAMAGGFIIGCAVSAWSTWAIVLIVGFLTAIACAMVTLVRIGLESRRHLERETARMMHPSSCQVVNPTRRYPFDYESE